jgi:hypothetical protein
MPFEFPTHVDNLETVPKEFQGLYAAAEDGSGFSHHPDFQGHIHGLTTALDKERKGSKTAKEQLKAWQELGLGGTPAEAKAAIDSAAEDGPEKGESQKQFEDRLAKMKVDMEAAFGTKLSSKDGEITQMRGSLEKHLITAEATSAIAALEGEAVLLMPHVRDKVKVFNEDGNYVARVVDKDGDPRGDGKGGFMTIAGLVAEMKKDPVFARAFKASGNSGGGTPPSGQGKMPPGQEKLSSTEKIARGLAART